MREERGVGDDGASRLRAVRRHEIAAEKIELGSRLPAVGFWRDQAELASHWALDREFPPAMPVDQRDRLYAGWKKAISRAREWEDA